MLWLFVGPTGVYLLDFFCSGIQFNLLLSPYPCFISLLYLDLITEYIFFYYVVLSKYFPIYTARNKIMVKIYPVCHLYYNKSLGLNYRLDIECQHWD